ncbi:MAG: hypothetical protein QOC89_2778 [Paraburkholderia sp.]|jgi:hypothetical protein|nr:hypothetical protein [Paraburkholderia sp.]
MNLSHSPIDDGRQQTVIKELGVSRNGFRNRVTGLIQQGRIEPGGIKEMLIHSIRSDQTMAALGVSAKYNADWNFLCSLRDKGRVEIGARLEKNYQYIGHCVPVTGPATNSTTKIRRSI